MCPEAPLSGVLCSKRFWRFSDPVLCAARNAIGRLVFTPAPLSEWPSAALTARIVPSPGEASAATSATDRLGTLSGLVGGAKERGLLSIGWDSVRRAGHGGKATTAPQRPSAGASSGNGKPAPSAGTASESRALSAVHAERVWLRKQLHALVPERIEDKLGGGAGAVEREWAAIVSRQLARELSGSGLTRLVGLCRLGCLSPLFVLQSLYTEADKCLGPDQSLHVSLAAGCGLELADRLLCRYAVVLLVFEPFARNQALLASRAASSMHGDTSCEFWQSPAPQAQPAAAASSPANTPAAGGSATILREAAAAACCVPTPSEWFDPALLTPGPMRAAFEELQEARDAQHNAPTAAATGNTTASWIASQSARVWGGVSAFVSAAASQTAGASLQAEASGVDPLAVLADWVGDGPWLKTHSCLVAHGEIPPTLFGLWAQRMVSWSPTVSAAFAAAAELLRLFSTSGVPDQSAALLAAQFLACCDDDLAERCASEVPVFGLTVDAEPALACLPDSQCAEAWRQVASRLQAARDTSQLAQQAAASEPGKAYPPHLGTMGSVPVVCGAYVAALLELDSS